MLFLGDYYVTFKSIHCVFGLKPVSFHWSYLGSIELLCVLLSVIVINVIGNFVLRLFL